MLARLVSSGVYLDSSPLKGILGLLAPRFPLLSPAMVYDGPLMTRAFKPRDANGAELAYMR